MNERLPGIGSFESGVPTGAESTAIGTEADGAAHGTGTKPGGRTSDRPVDDPRALQILSTEHFSLLSSRSLAYNEAFARTGMFLTFLSASLIVLGFLVGPLGLTRTYALVAVLLLGASLFIGLSTLNRLLDASHEELEAVRGMNRIRHAYVEMVPGLEPYFVAGIYDDALGVLASYGISAANRPGPKKMVTHGLATTPGMVGIINAFIAGGIGAVTSLALELPVAAVIVIAIFAFGVVLGLGARLGMDAAVGRQERAHALFPTPADGREAPSPPRPTA